VPSFHLPARKQPFPRWFLPFSTLPSQVRHCHLPLESPLLARAGYPRRMMVHFSWHAGTRVAPGAGKPLRFCLECRCRAWANPTIGPARRLFPPPAQVLPIVIPPSCATLVVCRWDQQRTVDYLRPLPAPAATAQGRCKERSMCRWGPHASAALLLPGRHRASVGGTVPVELRFLLSTLLMHMKKKATDRFMRDTICCC
jgi:hypothetical protein